MLMLGGWDQEGPHGGQQCLRRMKGQQQLLLQQQSMVLAPKQCLRTPDLEMLWKAAESAVMDGMARFADVDAAEWRL